MNKSRLRSDAHETGSAQPGRCRRVAGPARWAAVPVVALVIVAATTVTVLQMVERADDARRAQVSITRLEASINRVSAIEWQATAERAVSDELARAAEKESQRAHLALADLTRFAPEAGQLDPITAGVAAFTSAAQLQLALIGRGRFGRAAAVDEERVDPSFSRLTKSLEKARERYAAVAASARHATFAGVVGAPLVAALLVGLLLWRFIAARRRAAIALGSEQSVRASEERFRALIQNSSDLVIVVDDDGGMVYLSAAVSGILGYEELELQGLSLGQLIHPDDRATIDRALAESRISGSVRGIECRMLHRDSSWHDTETGVADLRHVPGVEGIVLNTREVTERKALQDQLTHQAFHDGLTGLANRALFSDRVAHAMCRRPDANRVAVLFIDLDDFKTVNDSLGHPAGDAFLVRVGEVLRECVRPSDTVARLGGDEFAVLLEDSGEAEALEVGERILAGLAEYGDQDPEDPGGSASIGVATNAEAIDADEILRNADVAMYMAKGQGKGRCAVFEPAMHHALMERLHLTADLRSAIEDQEFLLHYQPLVDLRTDRIVGVEALVRWRHPRRGLLGPNEFIPLAEETGLILPLGRFVLGRACSEAQRWNQELPARGMSISVNVSERQLRDPAFPGMVAETLQASGLAPALLTLELTESLLIDESDETLGCLHALKALGIQLAIDDFGMGYSSLSYLRRLPVDTLKIDKSFVDDVALGGQAAGLAKAIIDLGEMFGLQTVAEGIEHSVQSASLQELGCEVGQGFHFAEPQDADAICALLRANGRTAAAAPGGNEDVSALSTVTSDAVAARL